MPSFTRSLFAATVLLVGVSAFSQQPEPPKNPNQPQVRVNYLNVCTPSEDDQKEIRLAFSHIPAPRFGSDFEISRGTSTVEDAKANWVRIRREFPATAPFIAAQYAISVDEKDVVETLVFRSRESKDILQVQLEVTVTGALDAKSVVTTDTPVNRMRLERLGKSSVVLARCPAADQKAYEPLFKQASDLLTSFRNAIGVKRIVPRELAMLAPPKPATKAAAPKKK